MIAAIWLIGWSARRALGTRRRRRRGHRHVRADVGARQRGAVRPLAADRHHRPWSRAAGRRLGVRVRVRRDLPRRRRRLLVRRPDPRQLPGARARDRARRRARSTAGPPAPSGRLALDRRRYRHRVRAVAAAADRPAVGERQPRPHRALRPRWRTGRRWDDARSRRRRARRRDGARAATLLVARRSGVEPAQRWRVRQDVRHADLPAGLAVRPGRHARTARHRRGGRRLRRGRAPTW